MISSWAAWILTVGAAVILGIGLYLLAYHRGYLAGLGDKLEHLPTNPPWAPPSEAEFLTELLERERLNEPPRKYRREP